MQTGSIVIVNDLLGFCVGRACKRVKIQDKKGDIREVLIKDDIALHEVTNPHALAKLFYDKAVSKLAADK